MKVRTYLCFAFIVLWLQFCAQALPAQTSAQTPAQIPAAQAVSGTLRGQVTDPSGAAIANADVVMTPAAASAALIKTKSDGQGAYEFKGLAAGQYVLTVVAQGFAVYENDNVVITLGAPLRLNVATPLVSGIRCLIR